MKHGRQTDWTLPCPGLHGHPLCITRQWNPILQSARCDNPRDMLISQTALSLVSGTDWILPLSVSTCDPGGLVVCCDWTGSSWTLLWWIPYTPARPLRSATSGRLPPPARHICTSRSRLLSVLAPQWWNDLPVDVITAETLSTFKRRLKTHLFRLHLSLPPS